MRSTVLQRGSALALLAAALVLLLAVGVNASSQTGSSSMASLASAHPDAYANALKTLHRYERLHEHAQRLQSQSRRATSQGDTGSISILLLTPDFDLNRPAYNTTCKSVDTGSVYQPSQLTLLLPQASFQLPVGLYDCTVDQPNYYRFTERLNATSDRANVRFFHLLPVSHGVTIIYSLFGAGGSFFPNMTFPRGAFPFRYATAMSISGETASDVNYGSTGRLPARYRWSPWLSELTAASAGTYHYSVEAMHLPPLPPIYPDGIDFGYNFLNNTQRVSIFVGNNQQNGFKGTYESRLVNAKSWHMGSLSVTNPSEGCSRYTWHKADTYSSVYGINPDSPAQGAGEFLLEECFDVSDEALRCANIIYQEDVETATCGAFGDPHIVMFNGTGVTCGRDTAITLVDNKWFSLVGSTTIVDNNPVTTLRSVTFTYKGSCNPSTVTFNDLGAVTDFDMPNSPIAQRHRIRLQGNNIYVDAIRLRVQVRAITDDSGWPTLAFGVSMPNLLIANSTGVCVDSCPEGSLVAIDSGNRKRDPSLVALALAACEDAGLNEDSFERQACLFDVETTGDANYAQVASSAKVVQRDVGTQWANDRASSSSTLSLSFYVVAFIATTTMFFLF